MVKSREISKTKQLINIFNNIEKAEEGKMPSLKSIHRACGIDFSKIEKITQYTGSFTPKKINKLAPITKDQTNIVLDYKEPFYYTMHLYYINHYGDVNFDIYNGECHIFSDYAAAFNKRRKEEDIKAIIITVNQTKFNKFNYKNNISNFKKLLENQIKPDTKFIIENIINGCSNKVDFEWISAYDIKEVNGSRTYFIHNDEIIPFYMDRHTSPRIEADVIDKSGYFLQAKRHDLQSRAAALRAEREYNKIKEEDFTKMLEDISDSYHSILKTCGSLLKNINLFEEKQKFDTCEKIIRSLSWEFCWFKKFKNQIENQELTTYRQINNEFESQLKHIKEWNQQLNEIIGEVANV